MMITPRAYRDGLMNVCSRQNSGKTFARSQNFVF